MVLTQRRSNLNPAFNGLDPARIAGMAGAIALNAAALMLLMVPIAGPPQMPLAEEDPPPPVFIDPKPVEIPPTPPMVPVEKRTQRPTTAPIVTPTPPAVDTPILVDHSEMPLPPVDTPPQIDPGPPLPPSDTPPSARLQYASAPPPTYPREMMSKGLEGTVVLKVLVDIDGTPISVEIQRSSGHFKLDDAAKRQVLRKWKFKPAIVDGRATQVYGIIPISFSLTRE